MATSNSYYFTANCLYNGSYVKAGSTVNGGPSYSTLPPYVEDLVANQFGAASPPITCPSGGGGPLSFQPHAIAR